MLNHCQTEVSLEATQCSYMYMKEYNKQVSKMKAVVWDCCLVALSDNQLESN